MLKVVCTTFFIVSSYLAFGQYAVGDLNLDGDIASWYDGAIGEKNIPVLEGTHYLLPDLVLKYSPYFISNKWEVGQLTFDGENYENMYLLYNINEDVLIIRNMVLQNSMIEATLLNQAKVDEFEIHGHEFVHLWDSLVPSPGYYELFFDGEIIDFYIKRIKNEYVNNSQVEFKDEDRYYFFDGDSFVKYKGKKSLYKHYPEIKTELKNYVRTLSVNLKSGEEKGMREWLTYADKLLNEE